MPIAQLTQAIHCPVIEATVEGTVGFAYAGDEAARPRKCSGIAHRQCDAGDGEGGIDVARLPAQCPLPGLNLALLSLMAVTQK